MRSTSTHSSCAPLSSLCSGLCPSLLLCTLVCTCCSIRPSRSSHYGRAAVAARSCCLSFVKSLHVSWPVACRSSAVGSPPRSIRRTLLLVSSLLPRSRVSDLELPLSLELHWHCTLCLLSSLLILSLPSSQSHFVSGGSSVDVAAWLSRPASSFIRFNLRSG